MSCPQTIAVPASGARNPVAIFIVVDLPAPFGPRKPSTSPRETVNETSSTATKAPNCLQRLRISSIATLARRGRQDQRHDSKRRLTAIPRPPSRPGVAMIRRIHLISGLVMLAYVAMHLLNHALGLVSIDAMEWALARIVVPIWSLPPMRIALYGAFAAHYSLALWSLWQRQTLRLRGSELLQLMLGLHFWLRVRPWYARYRELGLTVAVLVPVLALLGTAEAARQVAVLAADMPAAFASMRLPTPETG